MVQARGAILPSEAERQSGPAGGRVGGSSSLACVPNSTWWGSRPSASSGRLPKHMSTRSLCAGTISDSDRAAEQPSSRGVLLSNKLKPQHDDDHHGLLQVSRRRTRLGERLSLPRNMRFAVASILDYTDAMPLTPLAPRPSPKVGLRHLGGVVTLLAAASLSCFYPWKQSLVSDAWTCEGVCTICAEVDALGACTSTDSVSANINAGGDVISKLVCADNADEANDACIADLTSNVADALPDWVVESCSPTPIPALSDAQCIDGSVEEARVAGETSFPTPLPPNVSLSANVLKINPASSSAAIAWRGHTTTRAISGWIQFFEAPFIVNFVHIWSDDVVLGPDTFDAPNLLLGRPLLGLKGDDGSYVVDLGIAELQGTYQRNSFREHSLFRFPGAATGTINLSGLSFTTSVNAKDRADSLSISLAGTVVNRPPVASFTVGTVANCLAPVNGSGSSDPDGGSITAWHWSVNQRPAGVGSSRSVPVHQGLNTIRLVVTDNEKSVSRYPRAVALTVSATPACP